MDSPVGLQAEKERSFSHSIDFLLQTKELDKEELEIVFLLVVTMSLKMIKVLAMSN